MRKIKYLILNKVSSGVGMKTEKKTKIFFALKKVKLFFYSGCV